MIFCTCTDWAQGVEILNAALYLWYNHGTGGGHHFASFRYCPWCGKPLAPDVERRVADHPEQVPCKFGGETLQGTDGRIRSANCGGEWMPHEWVILMGRRRGDGGRT